MQYPSDKQQQTNQPADLEQRLVTYYGPHLREQPLTQHTWEQVRRRLKPPARHRERLQGLVRHVSRRRSRGAPVPEYIYAAFSRIAYDAHISYSASLLHCTFKRKLRAPAVRVSPLRMRPVRLLLPVDAERSLASASLTMLLVTGVARYQLMKKALLIYVLCAVFVTLGMGATIFYAWHKQPLLPVLIVLITGPGLLFLLDRQRRQVCYAADVLVVLWIGRGRACEGLHALARYTRVPQRGGWGEPSLTQRIVRVCGTRVESGNERLTMVR